MALYHEELAGQLQASRTRLLVRNPAMASTKLLVDALHASLVRPAPPPAGPAAAAGERFTEMRRHPWLYALVFVFGVLLAMGTVVFHETNFPDVKPTGQLSWVDAFYLP